jgi:hypothetical protein
MLSFTENILAPEALRSCGGLLDEELVCFLGHKDIIFKVDNGLKYNHSETGVHSMTRGGLSGLA